MPEEKIAAAAEPVEDALPVGDSPFKAAVQDEATEADAEEAKPGAEQSETSEAEAESSTAEEKKDDVVEDEVSAILKKAEPKDNVQKRFDQLTARLKLLEEENSKLRNNKALESKEVPEYTEQQLRTAMKKAIEDGDSDLMFEIMDYRAKKVERDLIKKYEDVERKKQEEAENVQREWKRVVTDYSNAWSDGQGAEIYKGARQELDISNRNSLLMRVAEDLYNMQDEKGNYVYRVPGGQKMVVADALAAILKQKKLQPQDNKVKKLERTLAKEKRKKSLAGDGFMEEDAKPARAMSDSERLEEVIEERKKYQAERGK